MTPPPSGSPSTSFTASFEFLGSKVYFASQLIVPSLSFVTAIFPGTPSFTETDSFSLSSQFTASSEFCGTSSVISTLNIERSDSLFESDVKESNQLEISKAHNPSDDFKRSHEISDSLSLIFSNVNGETLDLPSSDSLKLTLLPQSRDFGFSLSPKLSDDFGISNLFGQSISFGDSLTNDESEIFQRSIDFADSLTQISINFGDSADFKTSASFSILAKANQSKVNDLTADLLTTNQIEGSQLYYSEFHVDSALLIDSSAFDSSSLINSTSKVENTLTYDVTADLLTTNRIEGSQLYYSEFHVDSVSLIDS
jgi:hypothetical protein